MNYTPSGEPYETWTVTKRGYATDYTEGSRHALAINIDPDYPEKTVQVVTGEGQFALWKDLDGKQHSALIHWWAEGEGMLF